MVPRVEDLTRPPIIGETYMVPCIWGTSLKVRLTERFKWLPIIGPRHNDAEYIKFDKFHYHFDHQFLSDEDRDGLYGLFESRPLLFVAVHFDESVGIVHWPMICMRHVERYPRLSFSNDLDEAYCAKTVTCGKCPHRGLPLGSLPREPGTDIVTCPGHGLRWDLKTGRMVKGAHR